MWLRPHKVPPQFCNCKLLFMLFLCVIGFVYCNCLKLRKPSLEFGGFRVLFVLVALLFMHNEFSVSYKSFFCVLVKYDE